MITKLPQPIETYFQASNSYDSEQFADCFAENAVVRDEGKEYRGPAAIKKWIEAANNKLQVKTEVTAAVGQNGETIVTATVSGNFEGSPIPLDFHFTVESQKITALRILLAGVGDGE